MNPGYLKYARVGWNYLRKKTKLPAGRILGVTIEPTNICNLSCVYLFNYNVTATKLSSYIIDLS